MQRVGCVLHVSSSRNLILRAEALPKTGAKVVDENLKAVGAVFDVVGSVSSPYVVVRPAVSELQRLVGSMLYTIPFTGKRKEKRKEKRKYGR